MTDNPKSLASLADDLEALAKRIQTGLPNRAADLCFRAAAALRAPTIAADDALLDNPTAFNTIDFRNELQPFLNDWLAKANRESQKHGFAESFRYDSNDRCLLDHILIILFDRIRKAIATPSPTIAALEPMQLTESEAAELDAFRAKPSRAEGLTFTPVPTIAAPSPSNEPAVEWVMCAVRDAMREHNFVVERGSDLWNRLRRHIEAALKARKPADDGEGQ